MGRLGQKTEGTLRGQHRFRRDSAEPALRGREPAEGPPGPAVLEPGPQALRCRALGPGRGLRG